jgi:hypothetical protein
MKEVKKVNIAGFQWLMHVILATQEAEIRRIVVQSQLGQTVWEMLSQKTNHKKRTGGAGQGVDPEFKSQLHKKR